MRLHKKIFGSGLVEREPVPALIELHLPLPLSSIDVAGIIGINDDVQTSTSSTHAATTATTASPTTSSKSGSSGGNGGNGGGSTTQTGSTSTPTGSSGNSGSGNGSGSGSGSGSNNGGSSDSNGSGGNSSASGSSVASAPGSIPTASTGTGSDTNGNNSDTLTATSGGSKALNNSSFASPSPVVNIAGDPSASSSAITDSDGHTITGTRPSGSVTTTTSAHGATATTVNGGSTDGNGGNSDGGSTTPSDGKGAASSGKVSPGVIAAICIVVGLVLLFLFLFGLRRWHKKRRNQRLQAWADRSKKGGLFFGAFSEKPATAGSANSNVDGSRSVRSSFGTTIEHTRPFSPLPAFDQSLSDNVFFSPFPSPGTSEAHTATSIVPDMPPVSMPQAAVVRSPSRNSSVFSIGSDSTHESGRDSNGAQYLALPPMQPDNTTQLSPISVRPFSPSESWAFPKPPTNPPTPSTTPRPLSGTTAAELPVPPIPAARPGDTTPTPADAEAQNPFADSQEVVAKQDPFADPERTPTMLAVASHVDVPVKRPTSSGTMRTVSTAAGSEASMGILEVIRRPFVPTLGDELAVKRGDQIRVLQCFDDGWAQIEKLETGETGLIPVDCLREAGEELPEFLAARRVSSYYGGVAV